MTQKQKNSAGTVGVGQRELCCSRRIGNADPRAVPTHLVFDGPVVGTEHRRDDRTRVHGADEELSTR